MVIWGARVSLLVGGVATLGASLIGSAIGLTAGYFGGRLDGVLMRVTDWFMVIPWLGLALVFAAILGPGIESIILVIVITSWAFPARIIRAQAWAVSARPFVERARAIGSKNSHIIAHHILPNSMPIIFTQMIITGAAAIYTESLLSFLGMGDPNSVSWGTSLDAAFSGGALTAGYWWQIAFPGACIILTILALTMVGYAFDQVLNPRLRGR
jgi:peptide/nickel transport system permease protein